MIKLTQNGIIRDEFWNLHPTKREINSSKSNNLPDWDMYFSKLCRLEYYSYEMMNSSESVMKAFEICAGEHLNNNELRGRIYRKGLSLQEFSEALEEVIQPIYQSAKNCGFQNWIYTGG